VHVDRCVEAGKSHQAFEFGVIANVEGAECNAEGVNAMQRVPMQTSILQTVQWANGVTGLFWSRAAAVTHTRITLWEHELEHSERVSP